MIEEASIRYEFPKSKSEREYLVRFHKRAGRIWVSTSIVDGQERMKFARLSHTDARGFTVINGTTTVLPRVMP